MFKRHQVAFAYRIANDASITEEALLSSYSQAVAPSVHHDSIARLECWFQTATVDGVDGDTRYPDNHHQHEGYQECQ